MRTTSKHIFIFILFVLAFVAAPPIGFLLALSQISIPRQKSKFSARSRLRELHKERKSASNLKFYFWFRKTIWPHFRSSKRVIWEYYCRPQIVIAILVCATAILSAILLLVHHVNLEKTSDYLSYGLWQVVITGFLAVSIVALAWILFSIELALKSAFTTLILSAIFSGCVVYARLLAIDFFSRTFPFPPTYAPVAFGMATTFLAASITSMIFAILALLFEVYLLFLLGSNFKKNKTINIILVVASGLGLLGAWFATFAMFEAIDPKGQLLIIKLAEKYDFTSNHMCDTGTEELVLFIDNVADRAIAATFPDVGTVAPRSLTKNGAEKYMPKGFHTVRCNPINSPIKTFGWCDKPSRFGYCQGK